MIASDIDKAVELLKCTAPRATIILFGSRARGDAQSDSDVDFMVVEPDVKSRHQEMARLARVLRPLRIPADVLVFSRKVFDEWVGIPGTVIYRAAREGKVLHVAE